MYQVYGFHIQLNLNLKATIKMLHKSGLLGSLYVTMAGRYGCCPIIIIIGIQPLGRSGKRPEFSQATGMDLVRCIMGKFLACHCFPPIIRCSHF